MNAEMGKEVTPVASSKTDPKTYWLAGVCFGFILGAVWGAMTLFMNPWNGAQFISGFQVRNAIAYCEPYGGLYYIRAVRFASDHDNDKIFCWDGLPMLYKYIKDLPKK